MKKRILSVLCTLCLIVGLLPTTAFAWTAPSNITIKDATYYSNGALSSITSSFYWSTAEATSRLVLMTKKLNTTTASEPTYGDFTDQGTYGSSFSSFDAVENYDKTNSTFGIISSSSEASVQMSQTNTLKIEFAENEIPLTTDALYYVYLWTSYGGHYYPDNLICAIQVKDGTVQYAGATGRNSYDAFDYVVSQEKFDVTITSGANMTKTDESGALTQADLTAPMTPVVFTANDGYYFPEEYAVNTVSGIRVVRNSETKITVEGAPTADASITLTAPTAKTFTVTYIANGGTGAVPTDNTAYLSNAEVTVKAGTDLTKEDFAFNGWNTAADGTGTKYIADDKFNINANTTLYAQWKSTVLEDVTFGYAYDVQRNPAYPAKDDTITASSLTKPLDADGTTSCATNEGNWTLTRAGTYAYVKSLGNDSTMLQGVVNNIVSHYSNITADEVVLHELKNGSKHIAYGVVVAYDAETGIAIYLGGNRSGGAGYLLSVDAQSGSVSAKAGMVATDFVPEQSISINKSGTHTFESKTSGYAAQVPVTVTVTNAGNTATGALNVTLSGTNADSFTLGDVDDIFKAGIALSGSDTFTVVPNVGLTAGTYTATITVSGQNIASKSFDVSFTVNAPTTYGVTVQNVGNGTAFATPSSAATGTDIILTATPSPGYKFKEWKVISGGVTISENKFSMPASDVTVKAIFEKETYTISWDTDGDGNVDGTTNVDYGDTPTHADGSKDEDTQYTYTFTGWNPAITAATGTATYTAQFTPVARSYGVTLYANSGTIASGKDITDYTYGVGATLPTASDMAKTGYAFDGWFDNASFTGTAVTAIGTTETGNKEYWAKWTENPIAGTTYTYAYDAQRSPSFPASVGAGITASGFTQPLKVGSASPTANRYASSEGTWTLTKVGYYADKSSFSPAPTDYLDSVVSAVATKYSLDTDGKNGLAIHKLTDKDGTHVGYGVVIAVDETNGYALFIGDLWNGSGAGYLLSKNAISANSVTFNAQQMAQSKYSISLTPTTVTFATAEVGYTAPDAQTITVSNTGDGATGALSVSLSGESDSKFELSAASLASIAATSGNNTATFTVKPKADLPAGTYTETITVKGDKVMPVTATVSFTVNASTTYDVTVQNDGHGTASATRSSAAAGTEITLTATPSDGYKFKVWDVISGSVTISENKFSMPASDVTVKAIFEKETYTISWDIDGDGNVDGTTNVAYGDTPTYADGSKTEDAQYTYTFTGWNPAITAAAGTATYTAQFTSVARSYGVTLNANSGTIASGKGITGYTYGVGAALPTASDITKTGYVFDGWFDNASFTGTAVTAIGTTETGNKEYWAKWTANQYTVTLNAQGGTVAPDSITVTYNGTYSDLVTPTRSSYTFAGWFTAVEGGTEVTNSTTVSITGPQTLYAHWTPESDAELEDVTFTHAYDVQRSPTFPAKNDTITLNSFKYPLDANGSHGTTNEGAWTLTEVGAYYTVKNTASAYLESVVNGIADNYTGITTDEIVIHELENGSTHVAYGVVVAYDAASGRAVFLGDTWNGGAGYLLATGTQTAPANMTATAVPTDFVQAADYRITLDKTGTYTFTAADTGYAAQGPATITVTNAGSAATGELTVALSGTNADSFTLSKSSITDIAVSGSDTFTVVPNTGLAAGTYTAIVTVSGTNVIPKSFDVTFTVNAITVTFDANGGTVTPTSNTTGADGKLTNLPTPTRSGSYSFKGWYTAANGGTQITTDTVFTENTTIFAQWTYTGGGYYPATYTVVVEDAANGDVSASTTVASKGTTVTIQIAPDKGYTLETLTATDRCGKEIELTKVSDGKYTFKMPASKVTVQATFMEDNTMLNFFVDVPADAYYYDAVLWAAKNSITEGTSATTFSPDMACTRAQMVTFLWRAVGSPEPTSNVCPFTDVDLDNYYGKAVLWAVEKGITKGTSTTTFSPDATCTRAQMATFLCRMADGKPVSSTNAFTDVKGDAYYADSVQWAVENGITNGTGNNKFSPDATCTRAQMVTFLYRYFVE